MSRVIKFRSWNGGMMRYSSPQFDAPDFFVANGCAYTLFDSDSCLPKKRDWPLMQFTGLIDRCGREICEGDIVRAPYVDPGGNIYYDDENYRAKVVKLHGSFGIVRHDFIPLLEWCEKKSGEYVPNYGNVEIIGQCALTVLGNIHETPELLK